MFGYVKAYKPELKIKDYETYRGVYCSLCNQLGKQYGLWSRFTLSYDLTFLAVLRMAVQTPCVSFEKARCPFNPAKKCAKVCGDRETLDFSAAVSMLLFYFKVEDNISDSGFFKRFAYRLIYPLAKSGYKRAYKKYPDIADFIAQAMQKQGEVEREKTQSIDLAADSTAKALAAIFKFGVTDEKQALVLDRLGYCVGRWVYLTDAFDDLEKDAESGDYNPFAYKYDLYGCDSQKIKQLKPQIKKELEVTANEAQKAFELLDINRFEDILVNILYDGMEQTVTNVSKDGAKS